MPPLCWDRMPCSARFAGPYCVLEARTFEVPTEAFRLNLHFLTPRGSGALREFAHVQPETESARRFARRAELCAARCAELALYDG